MKRPRIRFKSEQQILNHIDALRVQMFEECQRAEQHDASADENVKKASKIENPDSLKGEALLAFRALIQQIVLDRNDAKRLRRVQGRRKNKMEMLKSALAEFRTAPMPFIDASVVLDPKRAL